MSEKHGTSIEWTHGEGFKGETWNPVTGCSKVSPGCAHCYAESLTERYAGRPGWIGEHRPWTPENAAHNVILHPDRLEQPLHWSRPRMVFVNSMSDLFHEQVPDEYIAEVFSVMANCFEHTFQVLTKRPERMRSFVRRLNWSHPIETSERRWRAFLSPDDHWSEIDEPSSPLPNVWLGVSIENRRYVHRADVLRETPAAVRFISAEPLLGPLVTDWHCDMDGESWDWDDGYGGPGLSLRGIDWLIVGGESGPHHRPVEPEWVEELRDWALLDGCAFFFKQWGGRTPKAGGRELDGRTWDEMPARDEA